MVIVAVVVAAAVEVDAAVVLDALNHAAAATTVAGLDALNDTATSIAIWNTLNDAAVITGLDTLNEIFEFILVEGAVQGVGYVENLEGRGVDGFGVIPALLLDLHGWLVVDGLDAVAAAAADEFAFGGGWHRCSSGIGVDDAGCWRLLWFKG